MYMLFEFAGYHDMPQNLNFASRPSDLDDNKIFVGIVNSIDEAKEQISIRANFTMKSAIKFYRLIDKIPTKLNDNMVVAKSLKMLNTLYPEWKEKTGYDFKFHVSSDSKDNKIIDIVAQSAAYSVKYQLVDITDFDEFVNTYYK